MVTSPSETAGTTNCDFVIFPPRWLVMEDTFRPPWYHRNLMSEFMGLVYGKYDAKPEGIKPGGASLHNSLVPHGPDEDSYDRASGSDLQPHKLDGTLAFMFETRYRILPTAFALLGEREGGALDADYSSCWQGLPDQSARPTPRIFSMTLRLDHTHYAGLQSWVSSANEPDTEFPIQNLPLAMFRQAGTQETFRPGAAIGDQIVDLLALLRGDQLPEDVRDALSGTESGSLNALMGRGRVARAALRTALSNGLRIGASDRVEWDRALVPQTDAE